MLLTKYALSLKLLLIGGSVLFSLGVGAGAYGTHIIYRGVVLKMKLDHSDERTKISDAKSKYYEDKLDVWRRIIVSDRKEISRLNKILRVERAAREVEKKEFSDALAKSNLRSCDARDVGRVLRKKIDRERARHSRSPN